MRLILGILITGPLRHDCRCRSSLARLNHVLGRAYGAGSLLLVCSLGEVAEAGLLLRVVDRPQLTLLRAHREIHPCNTNWLLAVIFHFYLNVNIGLIRGNLSGIRQFDMRQIVGRAFLQRFFGLVRLVSP